MWKWTAVGVRSRRSVYCLAPAHLPMNERPCGPGVTPASRAFVCAHSTRGIRIAATPLEFPLRVHAAAPDLIYTLLAPDHGNQPNSQILIQLAAALPTPYRIRHLSD
jgi:hypothetical protein